MGSRDVNGSARPLFSWAESYLGIDVAGGAGVNLVADAAAFDFGVYDLVICTETLEHAANAEKICANANRLLLPGGVFIVTAAGPDRSPHSALDGGELRPTEFYRPVTRELLHDWLRGFRAMTINEANPGDIYALAFK